MHKSFTITYYHSNLIPEMLFDSEEDAEHFDTLLNDFIKDPRGKEEWKDSGIFVWFFHGNPKYAGKLQKKIRKEKCGHDCSQQFEGKGSGIRDGYQHPYLDYQRGYTGASVDE